METNIEGIIDKKYQSNTYKIMSTISFIIAAIFFWIGFDKMYNYSNPDSAFLARRNAYVGGDAYNYIINGTYATAFFVLGIGLMLMGCLCILIHVHSRSQYVLMQQNEKILQSLSNNNQASQSNVNNRDFSDLPSL